MANGTPNWTMRDVKRILAVFNVIGDDLSEFAERNGLFAQKLYGDNDDRAYWGLCWRRRIGGNARIEILFDLKRPERGVDIQSRWIFDDYPSDTLLVRTQMVGTYVLDKPRSVLKRLLRVALELVDAWGKADLDEHHPCMGWKKRWKTQAEFEKEIDRTQPFYEYHVR